MRDHAGKLYAMHPSGTVRRVAIVDGNAVALRAKNKAERKRAIRQRRALRLAAARAAE